MIVKSSLTPEGFTLLGIPLEREFDETRFITENGTFPFKLKASGRGRQFGGICRQISTAVIILACLRH
jgi:hypothetical protein